HLFWANAESDLQLPTAGHLRRSRDSAQLVSWHGNDNTVAAVTHTSGSFVGSDVARYGARGAKLFAVDVNFWVLRLDLGSDLVSSSGQCRCKLHSCHSVRGRHM